MSKTTSIQWLTLPSLRTADKMDLEASPKEALVGFAITFCTMAIPSMMQAELEGMVSTGGKILSQTFEELCLIGLP